MVSQISSINSCGHQGCNDHLLPQTFVAQKMRFLDQKGDLDYVFVKIPKLADGLWLWFKLLLYTFLINNYNPTKTMVIFAFVEDMFHLIVMP